MAKKNAPSRRNGDAGTAAIVSVERVEWAIVLVRSQKVMLGPDLATLYGVQTKVLNQAVRRNIERFPSDFMFQLTWDETRALRSQTVTLNEDGAPVSPPSSGQGRHIKYRPFAFTEQGVAMLSSVLRSARAVAVNIEIMRAFVRLRQIVATHKELARRMKALEKEFALKSEKHEDHIRRIYEILEALMEPPTPAKKGRIGFTAD